MSMKKFFVLFCQKNMFRPIIYQNLATVKKKIATRKQLRFQQFQSELDATMFIYPKTLRYLTLKQQYSKRGIDIEKLNKENLKPEVKQKRKGSKGQRQQEKIDEEKQEQNKDKYQDKDIDDDLVKDESKNKKTKYNIQKDQIQEQVQPKKQSQKNTEQVKVKDLQSQSQNNIQKQQILQNSKVNQPKFIQNLQKNQSIQQEINELIEQIQGSMKQFVQSQIVKINIIRTYEELLRNISNKKVFIKSTPSINIKSNHQYFAFFDGCSKSNPGPSGAGYIVVNRKGQKIFSRSINLGIKTNNQAEFSALIYCMLDCKHNKIANIKIHGDSQLAVSGLKGNYKITHENLKYLCLLATLLSKSFNNLEIVQIDRQNNKIADKLSNDALKKKVVNNQKSQIQ